MDKKTIEIALRLKDDLSKGLRASATKATAATNKISAGAKKVGASFKAAVLSVKGLVAAFLALAALRKVILWIKQTIELYIIQETAVNNLNAALIAQGNYTVETSDALQLYARQLQRLVGIGDEVTLGIMATIEGLTGLSGDALPKAMKAVVQISKLYKVDYNAASILLGKTLTSSLNAFSRYGIQIDMTGDAMTRLEGILEGTKAGFIMAEKEVNTFGGTVNILKMAWDDLRETVGFWIGASPGVIEILKTLTDKIELMDEAIKGANKSGTDLAGQAFAAIITESMKVIIYLNKAREVAIMTAIGFNKATRAAIKLIPASRAAEARALATIDANIAGLEKTLTTIIGTELMLENLIDDVNAALERSKTITIEAENAFANLNKITKDAPPILDAAVDSTDKLAESVYSLGRALRSLPKEFAEAPFAGMIGFGDRGGVLSLQTIEEQKRAFKEHPSYQMGQTIAGLRGWKSMYQPSGGDDTGGQTVGQIGEDYLKSQAGMAAMASSAFSGYQQGGMQGMAAGLLPTIGSAFGPWGSLAGGILGGIFGKKRRGSTPAEPVYTSDVKLHSSITELLNAVKSGLVMGSGAGINRISNQLKAQALAQGAI